MNWGKGITLVIILFIITMLGMVFYASKQTNEMVENNYYDKELKYQSLIDASKNLNVISTDSLIVQVENQLKVVIPNVLVNGFKDGNIEFLSNDAEKKDTNIAFSPDSSGNYIIPRNDIKSGYYNARIKWMSNEKNYYREQKVIIK